MPTTRDISEYGGWLELSREALLHNLEGVRRLAGSADTMAVVKANAYGAGAAGMALALEEAAVDRFAVATVAEAVELREAGVRGEIVCLTWFDRRDVDAIRRHRLVPTVFTGDHVKCLGDTADDPQPVWIKVDTGLGRLGVRVAGADAFIRGVAADPGLRVAGIYSTLTEHRTRDRDQLARMLALRERVAVPDAVDWSLASSHGILTLPDACLDVARPGVMLLGFPPSEPERMDPDRVATADLAPVVTWKTRIGSVRTVPAGEQVGYGEQPDLARDTRVASLMIGWSDGYRGSPERGSHVLAGGRRRRVLALSANTTLVDAGEASEVARGDEVVLLGRQGDATVEATELGRACDGVYRMLAGIPPQVPRIWT